MKESTLLFEVGSEALNDLTPHEKELILAAFTDTQVKQAALKVFDLLMKKYQGAYRMGTMYEDLSAKYRNYKELYNKLASEINAGCLGVTPDPTTVYDIDRYKWVKQTR